MVFFLKSKLTSLIIKTFKIISLHQSISRMKLSLNGSSLSLCLKETDSPAIYLLMVCGAFDRETKASYRLLFTLSDSNKQQVFQHPVHVDIEDLNDNAPEWSQPLYKLTFNRSYGWFLFTELRILEYLNK